MFDSYVWEKTTFFRDTSTIQRLFPLRLLNHKSTDLCNDKSYEAKKFSQTLIHNTLGFFPFFTTCLLISFGWRINLGHWWFFFSCLVCDFFGTRTYGRHADDTCELNEMDTWHRCETQYKQNTQITGLHDPIDISLQCGNYSQLW